MAHTVGVLSWRTSGGYTPEGVRSSNVCRSFPQGAVVAMLDAADEAHIKHLYAENERGGHARQVVAEVARALDVDLDDGPGHRWDPEHMARVISAALRLKDDRDHWEQEAENRQRDTELWKSLAQRQDNTAPLRIRLQEAERERNEWRSRYEGAQANALYVRESYTHPDEVDELQATIVRQAKEITRLKGEGE
ncbi:hypothetical protein ABZ446_28450 [Streptomyces sp. NPDC005813]|uniref:hypothetical protein n=1 Tax=Streptomyces sp. NPDC005813 TaxID=3155592 RepID=UPI0033F3242E